MNTPPRHRSPPPGDTAGALALAAFAVAYATVVIIRGVPAWVHVLYAVAGLASFGLYAIDKSAAVAGRGRIPERTLLAVDLAGGWPGALVAQRLLRHKTRKTSFRVRFWLAVVAHAAVVAALLATC